MASSSSIPLVLLLLLFPSAAAGFDITKILSQFSDFSTLNQLLTQSNLAGNINSRQTITVLAPDNSALSSANLPAGSLKNVLSLHVILDYYDAAKLRQLPNKTAILATLFQASGHANGQAGFLNATVQGGDGGKIAFGSAVPGSPLNADFVKVVVTQPYNISVLQISSVIVPPGVGGSPSPSQAPKAAPEAPAPSKGGASPTPSKSPPPKASGSGSAPAEAPATDGSSAKAPAEAPDSEAAGKSPTAAPKAADAADTPGPAAADDDKGSAAGPAIVGAGLAVSLGATVLCALL